MFIGKAPEIVAAVAAEASKDPGGTLGVWFMSTLVSIYFLGIQATQTATYVESFSRDSKWLKLLVGTITVLSIAQVLVVFLTAWQWFVSGYGDWTVVAAIPWTVWLEPIIAQLTVFFSQLFFAYRCFELTGKNPVLVFPLCAMVTGLALFAVLGYLLAVDPYNIPSQKLVAIPAMSINICAGSVITALISWKLMAFRKGVNASTDSVLNMFHTVTWETAALPALAAIVTLLVYVTKSGVSILYVFFNILLSRLYALSVIFTLNSHHSTRRSQTPQAWGMSNMSGSSARYQSDSSHGKQVTKIVFAPMGGGITTMGHSMGVIEERVGEEDKERAGSRPTSLDKHREEFLTESHMEIQVDLDHWESKDRCNASDMKTVHTTAESDIEQRLGDA